MKKAISNYDKAYKIAKKYIDNLGDSIHDPYPIGDFASIMPNNIQNPKWEMSQDALKTTLSYIFTHLSHPCYMLCIGNNKALIYKLNMESKDPAPIFQEAIENLLKPSLEINFKDGRITREQKKYIEDTYITTNDIRIMQCILRPFSAAPVKITTNNIYNKVFNVKPLPNGVFILNLTDANILREDGREPFSIVLGNRMMEEKYRDAKYLPILSQFGQEGYIDIPIPNYDDLDIVFDGVQPDGTYKHKEMILKSLNTNWDNKKYDKAVFRGGPAGCGYTAETNMRIKLATMQEEFPDYLNVGIVSKSGDTIDSKRTVKIDPIYGLGMMNTGIKSVGFLDINEQCKYKYIIHIDGNVNAYRLLETMRTGSLILRVKSEYSSWADGILIKPNEHYIEIESDLSDLISKIQWCRENDDECKKIAEEALKLSKKVLTVSFIQGYSLSVLWSLSDYRSKNAINRGYWEKMDKEKKYSKAFLYGENIPHEFIPPTKFVDDDFLEKLNKYYELKTLYEDDQKKINKDILKEDSSWKEKKIKFQETKPKCINCGREVGSIFNKTNGDDLFTKKLSVKCGSVYDPCDLDIRIEFSGSALIPNIIKYYQELIDQYNKDIIVSKNNLIFGYNNEDDIIKNFETIKIEFNDIAPILKEYIDLFKNITDNSDKKTKIDELSLEFYNIISDLKQQVIDYNMNNDPDSIISLIEKYIQQLIPLLKEINELRYVLNTVEVTKKTTGNIGLLVQKKYNIEDLEILIHPTSNAVINFNYNKGLVRHSRRNKTLKKKS